MKGIHGLKSVSIWVFLYILAVLMCNIIHFFMCNHWFITYFYTFILYFYTNNVDLQTEQ